MERDPLYAPSSRSRGQCGRAKEVIRRKNYSRLDNQGSFVFHVAPKVKVNRLSKRWNSYVSLGRGVGGATEPPTLPTLLDRFRNKYMKIMTSTATKASSTSIAPLADPKVAPSLTLGFGVKQDATVEDLGISLNKHEKKYLDHLRRSVQENRGGYNLGIGF